MNREDARIRAKGELESYLRRKGLSLKKPFRCLNTSHEDKKPSMSYHSKNQYVHCFGCGVTYDIFDLVGIDYGISKFPDQLNEVCERFGIDIDNKYSENTKKTIFDTTYKKENQQIVTDVEPNKIAMNNNNNDYISKRGLSKATAEYFNLSYHDNYSLGGKNVCKALVIPTGDKSHVARNTDESAASENRFRKKGASLIFNTKAISNSDEPIFICEGEIDAMSFHEIGIKALALGSTSNKEKFITYVEDNKPKNTFLLALDNDEPGSKATKELEKALKELGFKCYAVDVYNGKKDANEALVSSKKDFSLRVKDELNNQILAQAEEISIEQEHYSKNNVASSLDAFQQYIKDSKNVHLPSTGFKQLDKVLEGGLFDGLYIIGAISSLGKTTFLVQIADQIAKNGKDVLYFSLEMSKYEIMAKSISRETILYCTENGINSEYAKTVRGIITGKRYINYNDDEKNVIIQGTENYKKYADKLYIIEGLGDIGVEQIKICIEKHKKYTNNTPVVMIDYLQILSPSIEKGTDKQNIDKTVLELKRISRDFNTPVISISSLNRQSYKDPISMEGFKESGAIEYSSDVLIGLQLKGIETQNPNIDELKRKIPREIELKILKNRNGETGGIINFEYYSLFNHFHELEKQGKSK